MPIGDIARARGLLAQARDSNSDAGAQVSVPEAHGIFAALLGERQRLTFDAVLAAEQLLADLRGRRDFRPGVLELGQRFVARHNPLPRVSGGMSDLERARALIAAVPPDNAADLGTSSEVTLRQLPASLQALLAQARAAIVTKPSPADGKQRYYEFFGYYEVYRSATDHTIVGYAVQGGGSTRDDELYGMTIGFAPDGTKLFAQTGRG